MDKKIKNGSKDEPFFYNDWISYDYESLLIHEYPSALECTSLLDSAVAQAETIYETIDSPAVFISGGIDSQFIALAFAKFNIPNVFIKNIYEPPKGEPSSNWIEEYFVKTFCEKNNLPLTIVENRYNKDSLMEFLLETKYWSTGTGTGTIFQLPIIKEYDGFPITGDGHFVFRREGNTCWGEFKKPGLILSDGIKCENQILFDFYAPYMFQYYEYAHKNIPEIQYMPKMEAKNLIYTHGMGHFPFRPKLSGWEFLDYTTDYYSLTAIDWSNDHNYNARLNRGPQVLARVLGLDYEWVLNKFTNQNSDSNRMIKLYEFETKYYGDIKK